MNENDKVVITKNPKCMYFIISLMFRHFDRMKRGILETIASKDWMFASIHFLNL
jgi:hypothetical protein